MTIQRYAEKLQELQELGSSFVPQAEQALEAMQTMNRAPDSADWKAINGALEVARQGAVQDEMKPAPEAEPEPDQAPMPEPEPEPEPEPADDGATAGEVGGPAPIVGEVGAATTSAPAQPQEPEDPQPA